MAQNVDSHNIRVHHLLETILPGISNPSQKAADITLSLQAKRLGALYPEPNQQDIDYYLDVIKNPPSEETSLILTKAELIYGSALANLLTHYSKLDKDTPILLICIEKDDICKLCYIGDHCGITGSTIYGQIGSDFELLLKLSSHMGEKININFENKTGLTTWGNLLDLDLKKLEKL